MYQLEWAQYLKEDYDHLDGKLQIIQIVAIDKRDKDEIYKMTEQRLDG